MARKLMMLSLGVGMLACFAGCDTDTAAKLSDNPAVQSALGAMNAFGAVYGDQVQQRDRLQDGSGDNCVGDGDCDGTGPYGAGNQGGAGQGGGDMLHLRDGSCGD